MATIGTLNYLIAADATKFLEGMVATKREVAAVKQVMAATRTPIEDYGGAMSTLDDLHRRGLLPLENYVRQMRALKAELPGVRQELERQAAATALANRLNSAVEDPRKKYAREIAPARALFERGEISAPAFAAEQKRLAAEILPSVRAKQQAATAAFADAKQVIAANQSPLAAYAASMASLRGHLSAGRISQEVFNNAVAAQRQTLLGSVPHLSRFAGLFTPIGAAGAGVAAGVAVATAAVAAGVGAFVAINRTAMDTLRTLDEVSDSAKMLGVSAAALNEMHTAAQLADVSQQALTNGFEKMQVNLAGALAGEDDAVKLFRRLGLSATELIGLAPDKMLSRVAQAMAAIPTQSQKIDLARDMFGRGNSEMVNLIDDLAAATARAKELKAGLGDVDFAAVDQYDTAAKELAITFAHLKAVAASELAPSLTEAANSAAELLRDDATQLALRDTITLTTSAVYTLTDALSAAGDVAKTTLAVATDFDSRMPLIGGWLAKMRSDLEFAGKMRQFGRDLSDRLNGGGGDTANSNAAAAARAKSAAEFAAAGDVTFGASAKQKELAKSVQEVLDRVRDQTEAVEMNRDQLEAWKMILAGADAAQMELLADMQRQRDAADAARELEQAVQSLNDKLAEQVELLGLTADAAELAKLAKRGAAQEDLDAIAAMQETIAKHREQTDAVAAGKKVMDELKTPEQRFLEKEAELTKLLEAGAISVEAFHEAMRRAKQDAKLIATFDVHNVEALEQGTAQAAAAIAKFKAEQKMGAFNAPNKNVDGLQTPPEPAIPIDLSKFRLAVGAADALGFQIPEMPDVPPLEMTVFAPQFVDILGALPDVAAGNSEVAGGLDKMTDLLSEIRDAIKEQEPIEMEEVNL